MNVLGKRKGDTVKTDKRRVGHRRKNEEKERQREKKEERISERDKGKKVEIKKIIAG
jgi:hypothetical protein